MYVVRREVAIYCKKYYHISQLSLPAGAGHRPRSSGQLQQLMKTKGENEMRIAVTYENGMIGQHFGRTEQFKIYDAENGEVTASQVIDTLICGGIGPGARYALEDMGIRLLPGVMGNADDVVKSYLEGTLSYDPDAACHHHDSEAGHDCHHGQGCGDHKCN